MDDDQLQESGTATEAPADQPTGNPAVDEVLGSLEGLADRPVDEHVAVFERAHDRLRAALSEAGPDHAAG